MSSSLEAVHWGAPPPSILVPLWSLILKFLRPLGTPLAASGSPKAILNVIPAEESAAFEVCLTLNVVASLAANAATAPAAHTATVRPHTISLRTTSSPPDRVPGPGRTYLFQRPPATLVDPPAPWRSGYAAACKAVYTGSIPVGASLPRPRLDPIRASGEDRKSVV